MCDFQHDAVRALQSTAWPTLDSSSVSRASGGDWPRRATTRCTARASPRTGDLLRPRSTSATSASGTSSSALPCRLDGRPGPRGDDRRLQRRARPHLRLRLAREHDRVPGAAAAAPAARRRSPISARWTRWRSGDARPVGERPTWSAREPRDGRHAGLRRARLERRLRASGPGDRRARDHHDRRPRGLRPARRPVRLLRRACRRGGGRPPGAWSPARPRRRSADSERKPDDRDDDRARVERADPLRRPRPARSRAPARLHRRPDLLGRAARPLRPRLGLRRPRERDPAGQRLPHPHRRRSPRDPHPRRRRPGARPAQPLPPSRRHRLPPGPGARQALHLPVPRLGLRQRRRADRRPVAERVPLRVRPRRAGDAPTARRLLLAGSSSARWTPPPSRSATTSGRRAMSWTCGSTASRTPA